MYNILIMTSSIFIFLNLLLKLSVYKTRQYDVLFEDETPITPLYVLRNTIFYEHFSNNRYYLQTVICILTVQNINESSAMSTVIPIAKSIILTPGP